MTLSKPISINQLINAKFTIMDFEGKWLDSFGKPEMSGSWYIDGESGNGKTSLCFQLAKYLTNFGTIDYDSIEEGYRHSMKKAVLTHDMKSVAKRFRILHREPLDQLCNRLRKRRSRDIIFIDSIQHSMITKREYMNLLNEFNDKLFIFIGHAKGRQPIGKTAEFIKFNSDIKVHVKGYMGYIETSRSGGGKDFVIYKEKAEELWGSLNVNK